MDEETRETLRAHTQLFETSAPDETAERTTPFEAMAERRIVGVGTAAWGTREPTAFRHRLLQHLVAGVERPVVALPVGFADAMALDRYVTGEAEELGPALAALSAPYWGVESVADLFEWLREYNADRPDHERVRVYGLDAGSIPATVDQIYEYLDQVDPPFLETIRHNLATIQEAAADLADTDSQADALETLVEETEQLLPTVRDRLEDHRESYVTTGGVDAWERAIQYVTLLEQGISVCVARKQHHDGLIDENTVLERYHHLRGLTMADNLDWLVEFVNPGQILLLAHDSDVARVEQTDKRRGFSFDGLGALLHTRYGTDYYALGSLFGGGSVRTAWTDETEEPIESLESLTSGQLGGHLDTFESAVALIDLSTTQAAETLEDLLTDQEQHRSFRSASVRIRSPTGSDNRLRTVVTDGTDTDAFDGLCYFRSVSPATRLESGVQDR